MTAFSGFYKKTREARIDSLKNALDLSPEVVDLLQKNLNLSEATAGQMAENHLGTFALPYAVVPNFKVNNQTYHLPLVTEEPSVVAALSFGSQIIGRSGGFSATVQERLMIGQVALYEVPQPQQAQVQILAQQAQLLALANAAHPSIVKRGGGARAISCQIKEEFLIVYLTVDVQEAMGANMLNTMLEALKPELERLTQGQSLMGILSNYATASLTTATCRIPLHHLHPHKADAQQLAKKIALASRLAQVDPYRAATHNKGIFNGLDALVIATGNDWRAIEAGAHAYASRNGQYQGLSTWTIEEQDLVGQITLPLPLATVGGSIGLNPKVKASFALLGPIKAKTLMQIAASVALCQNFAALRALVSEGIQQGHMKLQAKSLALLAGATAEEAETVAQALRQAPHSNLETAKKIIAELRKDLRN